MYYEKEDGFMLSLPYDGRTEFYLEDSGNTHKESCFTIIDAALLEGDKEIALLLENDKCGEDFMALVIIPVDLPLYHLSSPTGLPMGSFQKPYALFVKKHHWNEAYNDIETELDDLCYENYHILTPEELDTIK